MNRALPCAVALAVISILLCGCPTEEPPVVPQPTLGATTQVIPSAGIPAEIFVQTSNNNLDVVMHDGRLFLAWRTAPSHFASPDVQLNVISRAGESPWVLEATFELGTDLREPRLLSWGGDLVLHFAVLGTNPSDFVPQGMMRSRRGDDGTWSEPEWFGEDGAIPWRTRVEADAPYLVSYTGGESIYDDDGEPVRVRLETSADGWDWEPVDPARPVILEGGASETDFVLREDGALVGVARNELGELGDDGDVKFGSKICRAEPGALADWTCVHDKRKYDSPLVFQWGGRVFLIGRRNVTDTGDYDLERDDLTASEQVTLYETDYWALPKRCALWEIDPVELSVSHVADLPSRGDTCFPGLVQTGEARFVIYNYSSDVDGEDLTWLQGQLGPTNIYATELFFR